MRVANSVGSRPAYYDRGAAVSDVRFAASVGPHATTSRGVYTVPAGRLAFLEFAFLSLLQTTVAAPHSRVGVLVNYVAFGLAGARILQIQGVNAALFDFRSAAVSQLGIMQAGDAVELFTRDASTGGVVEYQNQLKVIEFGA